MKKRLLSRAAALLTAPLLALQLAGCGASSGGSAENATAQTTASYDQAAVEESGEMEIAAEAPTADSAAKVNYDTGGTLTDTLNQTTMPEDLDLKLIWRASVSMETLEFDESVQQITDLVSEMGGFVESSSSSGGSDASGNYSSKYAYLTIRVPSDKLTGFMGSLNDCGTITSQNLSSENISLEYADTEARKEALQTEYDRLLELMAQADSENRDVRLIELSDLLNDARALLRVSGAVGKHDAVGRVRDDLLRLRSRRINRHVTASHGKGTGDVFLRAKVQKRHSLARAVQRPDHGRTLFLLACRKRFLIKNSASGNGSVLRKILRALHLIFLRAGNLLHHLTRGVGRKLRQDLFQIVILIGGDHAVHGSLFSQDLRQRPGIDSRDSGNVIFLQIFLNAAVGSEVAGHSGQLSHDKTVRPGPSGFTVLPAHAIVSDQRIGHADCLSRIGRVCQHFQITGHGCVEYDFTDYLFVSPDRSTFKYGTVFQYQICLHVLTSRFEADSASVRIHMKNGPAGHSPVRVP